MAVSRQFPFSNKHVRSPVPLTAMDLFPTKSLSIAVMCLTALATVVQAAPTASLSTDALSTASVTVSDTYWQLFTSIAQLQSRVKDVYQNFKKVRFDHDGIDISDHDMYSFTIEGLPTPISRYSSRFMEEQHLLILHRNNLKTFQTFLNVFTEEMARETENLHYQFHDEFQSLVRQLGEDINMIELLIRLISSELNTLQDVDVDTTNSASLRDDLRYAKVLHELYQYLPGARMDFEHLARNNRKH
ncbi:uncharacterized protein LOC144446683 [Glandiceps talaboti]